MGQSFNIGKYFTYKDKQSVLRRSNVMYKITCSRGDSNVEHTKRNLEIKIKEHNPGLCKNDTDVFKHLIENLDNRLDFNNVNWDNWRKLLIKETLLLQNQKPVQFSSVQFIIYQVILVHHSKIKNEIQINLYVEHFFKK